jgi:hypothetical protein
MLIFFIYLKNLRSRPMKKSTHGAKSQQRSRSPTISAKSLPFSLHDSSYESVASQRHQPLVKTRTFDNHDKENVSSHNDEEVFLEQDGSASSYIHDFKQVHLPNIHDLKKFKPTNKSNESSSNTSSRLVNDILSIKTNSAYIR